MNKLNRTWLLIEERRLKKYKSNLTEEEQKKEATKLIRDIFKGGLSVI